MFFPRKLTGDNERFAFEFANFSTGLVAELFHRQKKAIIISTKITYVFYILLVTPHLEIVRSRIKRVS
jgi:hypothetical protein